MRLRSNPYRHQSDAIDRMRDADSFALFAGMGTGKTLMLAADIAHAHDASKIDRALIIAPKGVYRNWIDREIPKHFDQLPMMHAWRNASTKSEERRRCDAITQEDLCIASMNVDALNTRAGFLFALAFCERAKVGACIVCDESDSIKNMRAKRTIAMIKLAKTCKRLRIATGTPISNSPLDIYAQMRFLGNDLGYKTFADFTRDHAVLDKKKMHAIGRARGCYPPLIVKVGPDGKRMWKNLDRLWELISPMAVSIKKEDCLDLPPKVYQREEYELAPDQARAYRLAEKDLMIEIREAAQAALARSEQDEIDDLIASSGLARFDARIVAKLMGMINIERIASLTKCRQILSGFIIANGEAQAIDGPNPKLDALMDLVARALDGGESIIVWAHFRKEIDDIRGALAIAGIDCVQYHGGVGSDDRERAIDAFQRGDARVFVGSASTGGMGITLTAATCVIYYSQIHFRERAQSEDRAHRIGQTRSVTYIDLIARDTIEESMTILNDEKRELSEAALNALTMRETE